MATSCTIPSFAGHCDGTPLQYLCLENPMDRGAWWAAVHGVILARIWSRLTFLPPGDLSQPWDRTRVSFYSLYWQADSLPLSHQGIVTMFSMFIQFSSVTQSCPTLCDPMNRSTPGLPVHHHLPEFTQTHIHRVSDAIQPTHPLSSPSSPAPNPSRHQSLFQ